MYIYMCVCVCVCVRVCVCLSHLKRKGITSLYVIYSILDVRIIFRLINRVYRSV